MSTAVLELTDLERELLRAAATNHGELALFRRSDTRGPAVRAKQRVFFDKQDPTVAPAYIAALKHLVELSLVRAHSSESYELTNSGWQASGRVGK